VAAWLVSQHERAGLAGYWQADATTVTSGGRVLVAPIVIPATSKAPVEAAARRRAPVTVEAAADRWESSAAWYQPAQRDATFVIAVTGPGAPAGLSPAAVRASFGPPAAEHRIGQDLIMLYRYNLLTRLRGAAFPSRELISGPASLLARDEEELLAEQPPQRWRAEVGAGQRG